MLARSICVIGTTLLSAASMACTGFVVSTGERTYIGNNEDAWSINPQVRFEQGRNGGYGAIFFGHYNGHPLRVMTDQLGMNEAGLVYDGLSIQSKEVSPMPGLRRMHFNELMPLVLRTCATVQEAAALLGTYDRSVISGAMIFLADKHGAYLIVENDTMITGHEAWYAVGNWRMGRCSDPGTIPIPRLQAGREMLAGGTDGSFEEARAALERMTVCREKMGEGTLFSTLFDPMHGNVHLYFYHDFSEAITFDLKAELAKGDRTVPMETLFGTHAEFERLKAYATPFHQRWLFRALLGLLALTLFAAGWSAVALMRSLFRRSNRPLPAIAQALLAMACCLLVIVLLGIFLMQESVYYFGLTDLSAPLAAAPITLLALSIALLLITRRTDRHRPWSTMLGATIMLPLMFLLTYWELWWP